MASPSLAPGYDRCDELCRPLARWRGCVWHREGLTRQRAGAVQHSLNARQRRQNLKNAFQLEFAVQGLHIALVDDVVTTGSTVAEISRLLLRKRRRDGSGMVFVPYLVDPR